MSRMLGTVSMGVRAPIIREGDNMVEIVTGCILEAMKEDGLVPRNRDIVAMTEAIVARAQGNYATVDDIAADVRAKLGGETVGVMFPILSRNRFAICLRGIAKGCKKIVLMLSYPSDEVGNHLIDWDLMDEKGVDPYKDVLSEEKYRELFGYLKHPFTGVDYVEYYSQLIQEMGCECEDDTMRTKSIQAWVLENLGHMPNVDEEFEWGELTITVTDIEENRVKRVEVKLNTPELEVEPASEDEQSSDEEEEISEEVTSV